MNQAEYVIDHEKYILGKDKNGQTHYVSEVQDIVFPIVLEIDRICRKNNIPYALCFGSALGIYNYGGFLPWDDDADIGMLREDYDRFKQHLNELDSSICYFQDHDTDPEYRWGYGKLRRTGTKYIRVGQEHLKCKTGIFVDVFPMDDIPLTVPGQILQDWHCFCLRKILWSEVARVNTKGFWKIWFTMLSKIPISVPFNGSRLCFGKIIAII